MLEKLKFAIAGIIITAATWVPAAAHAAVTVKTH